MSDLNLFTDGSVNTQSNVGHGAYLLIPDGELLIDSLSNRIKTKRFSNTTSTKLELQTFLWALSDIQAVGEKIIIYTDSQNIIGLQGRREQFEKNNYRSKNGRPLNNSELYKEFYRITDQLNCEFIKVQGHKKSKQKDSIERIFTLVDRASRKALRKERI